MKIHSRLLLLLFCCQAYGAKDDTEARIQALEAEIKQLKHEKQRSNTPALDKTVQTHSTRNLAVEPIDTFEDQDDLNIIEDLGPLDNSVVSDQPVNNSLALKPQQLKSIDSDRQSLPVSKQDLINNLQNEDRASELYEQAIIMLGQRKLTQAQQICQEIISAYPESAYFIIAQYWLGELALENQDYMAASLCYGTIYEKYKAGQVDDTFEYRVAESLIKFAYCLGRLKKNEEACIILREFDQQFKKMPKNLHTFAQETRFATACKKT